MGTYIFQLTVTDTAQQQDFTNITIMVLNSEQTEGEPEPTDVWLESPDLGAALASLVLFSEG